jgi:hypothetical protein
VVGAQADDDEHRGNGPADRVFEAELVRVADMGSAQPLGPLFIDNGTDPLESGSVSVTRQREVEFQVRGAVASATYAASFCPFGFATFSCVNLGTFKTNAGGNWTGRLAIPVSPQSWVGVFLLKRNTSNQFVSGFVTPPLRQAHPGTELDLWGKVGAVNLLNHFFQLERFPVNIFVGAWTRFHKISGLNDLRLGDQVVVTGVMQADGSIFATRVRNADDGQDGDR